MLSGGIISQAAEESPVSPAQRTGENETYPLCGKLLLENFCISLNLPVNQNLFFHPMKSQSDLLPLKFSLFFAPIGSSYFSSLFASCVVPQ